MGMNAIIEYVKETKYNIGFVKNNLESVIEGAPIEVVWLKHSYTDRWFADPFILDITNTEIIVLVEEWYDPIQRGRISRLTIDKQSYELKDLKVVLDNGTHLSFPAIERIGHDIYIHPENSVTGKLDNYKFNKEKDCFERVGTLCNCPMTDAVFTNLFGKKKMLSTKLPDANGKELGIYEWDEEQGLFSHKINYHFAENISRMAGDLFECNGKIYRPAQLCVTYGDAVSLQKVDFQNGEWFFQEIRRIYSPSPLYDLGFHTFNVYQGYIVVDGLGFRHPQLSHIIRWIRRLFK